MKAQHKRKKLDAPLHVSALLDAVLHGLGADAEQVRLLHLWQNWSMVMGQELACLAVPLGVRQKILLVGAQDSIAMQELHLQSEEILERVNAFMESSFFTGINLSLNFAESPPMRINFLETPTCPHGNFP
jgi:hypothetical protein